MHKNPPWRRPGAPESHTSPGSRESSPHSSGRQPGRKAPGGLKSQEPPSGANSAACALASARVLPGPPPMLTRERGPSCPATPHSPPELAWLPKSRAHQGGGGDVSAGIQALVVRSVAPPPHLPKSTHPPLYPLLGAFWVAALHRGRPSSSLEPLDIGVGGLTHLAPLPGADGAAPTPMGAGTPSGPSVFRKKEAAALRRLTRAG